MHSMFDLTRVQTHDLQIMDNTFNIPEMLVLTTEPSGTSKEMHYHIILEVYGEHAQVLR